MKILVTAALPYINNVPHMGHMVGSHLPADVFARFCRQMGHDVAFVGGSDEHGTPSVIAARNIGMDTQEFVDKLHVVHKEIYVKMGITYDIYSRTSCDDHHKVTQDFFNNINPKLLIEKEEQQYYSEEDKMFLPDRFLKGECPACGYDDANSDQCEKCGKLLSSKELVNPKSTLSGSSPVLKTAKHIYIDLEKLEPALAEWVDSKEGIWKNHVLAEAKKWIKEGLRARAITRDMSWGVKVPKEGYEDKVFYVWFDAPIGYITFTKEFGRPDMWKKGEAKIYHFLGKDNIPFHTIFWPGLLLANDIYEMPYNVVGYNYLNFEGQKFSKSKGIGVFCYNLLTSDIDIDTLRYYLVSSLPESKDADFKWDSYAQTVNSELIGNLANFFNRTVSMSNKYFDGKFNVDLSNLNETDQEFVKCFEEYPKEIRNLFEKCEIRQGLKKILEYSSKGNSFIDTKEPWNLAKEGKEEELKRTLYLCLNLCRSLSIFMSSIVPEKMEQFWKEQLTLTDIPSTPGLLTASHTNAFPIKVSIGKPNPLYQRIDIDRLEKLKVDLAKPYGL